MTMKEYIRTQCHSRCVWNVPQHVSSLITLREVRRQQKELLNHVHTRQRQTAGTTRG